MGLRLDTSQFVQIADNMPRPIYIICAESIVEDKNNSITFFRVMEKIGVARIDFTVGSQPPKLEHLKFELASVWMREENEANGPFEYEFRLRIGKDYLAKVDGQQSGQFSFARRMHRFIVRGEIGHFPAIGILEMECRVR